MIATSVEWFRKSVQVPKSYIWAQSSFLSNRKDCWTKGLPHRGLKCSYNQAFFSGILQAPIAYLSHSKKISLKKEDIINWWHVMSGGATWTSRWQLAKGWVWSHRSLATSLRLHQAVSEASPQPGNNNTLIKYRKWDHILHWRNRRGIKTFSYRCTFNISTSKAHLSMWRVLKRTSAVFLFRSWKINKWKLVSDWWLYFETTLGILDRFHSKDPHTCMKANPEKDS